MSTKNERLRKSSTFFVHFKSMKSSSVPVVAMKETQPELWFCLEDRREKRWRKYATDGLMLIHASQA
jgi:phenylalanine-4-hydroxylase